MVELVKDIDILSQRAKEFDVRGNQDIATKIVQDLEDAMDNNKELLFVCSKEVGHLERAIDVRFTDDTYVFMNPVIKSCGNVVLAREIDRINGKEYIVPRFSNIELIFQDCLGSIKGIKFNDMPALIISQAMDMLDGIYPSDIGLEIIPEFDSASKEEQNAVIEEYLKSLTSQYKHIDEELSNSDDENVRKQWDAVKFMIASYKGDVKFDEDTKKTSKREQKRLKKLVDSVIHRNNKLKFWNKLKTNKNNSKEEEKDNNVS